MNKDNSKNISPLKLRVSSEIGKLEGVIIHTPGSEVENMTPETVERALYSDVLNLAVVLKEYGQFKKVLQKFTRVYEVKDLLMDILKDKNSKEELLTKICKNEQVNFAADHLNALSNSEIVKKLIEGVPIKRDNLSRFLSKERFILQPLHNFFFTRDTSAVLNDFTFISSMKNMIREREAIIMESIYKRHPLFETEIVNSSEISYSDPSITFEGGDIIIARENIVIIGISARTSASGIDFLIEKFKKSGKLMHIIVQEIPYTPESFIHLDMVFTFVDYDQAIVYSPLILHSQKFETIIIKIDNGEVKHIGTEDNILTSLKKLGLDIQPVYCGGKSEQWNQEREQWHSGANFFSMAPGKIIGYGRNVRTLDELNSAGFDIVPAKDIINNKIDPLKNQKIAVTIDGSELARGGGGCRCMTLPIKRKDLQ